jgi:hypothetical protein
MTIFHRQDTVSDVTTRQNVSLRSPILSVAVSYIQHHNFFEQTTPRASSISKKGAKILWIGTEALRNNNLYYFLGAKDFAETLSLAEQCVLIPPPQNSSNTQSQTNYPASKKLNNQARAMTNFTGNMCHILPCSIDDDMTAPTAQYFHPTPLHRNDTLDDAENENDRIVMMAAQFRGRGLICAADCHEDKDSAAIKGEQRLSTLPKGVMGVALSQSHASSGNDNSRPLKVVESFTQIYNWQHEHDVDKVKRSLKEGGSEKIGLKAALGWCELAHAVSEACVVFNWVCVQFF